VKLQRNASAFADAVKHMTIIIENAGAIEIAHQTSSQES